MDVQMSVMVNPVFYHAAVRSIIWFNTHTRTADDRLVSVARDESISFIMVAIGLPMRFAKVCNASMNSGSRVMLVWWPDKDTDIFFIMFFTFCLQLNNPASHDMGRHICEVG